MSTINDKISWPLLAAFIGAAIGALSGQFVWTLLALFGVSALIWVAQNLSAFLRSINTRGQTTIADADERISSSIENSGDWLRKWKDDMDYCPTYRGTPGNIWRGPRWASDD